MPDSKDERGPGSRPAKPVVPPFRGPGSGGASPLKPVDNSSRMTRPPFVPPAIAGRKATPPAVPQRPTETPASATPRPMSSSTVTPAPVIETFAKGVDPTDAAPAEDSSRAAESRAPVEHASSAAESRPSTEFEAFSSALGVAGASNSALSAVSPAAPVSEVSPLSAENAQAGSDAAASGHEQRLRAVSDLPGFVDPAPFMGTRDVGVPATPTRQQPTVDIAPPQARVTSHPVAQALRDIAARLDNGEFSVASDADHLTPEAALAALLAEMLKHPR